MRARTRRRISWQPLVAFVPLAVIAQDQPVPQDSTRPAADQSAAELVRSVIQNEIKAEENDHTLWGFRLEKWEDGKDKSFMVCQATEGVIYRLVALNGKALGPKEQEAEKRRVAKAIERQGEVRDRQRKVTEDAKRARKLMASIPDAFLFQRESMQGDLVKLHFTPNPRYHASGRAETVFHHLEGTITVDSRQKRLADIRGKLMNEVKFGGGLFGHLDKGGTFWVSQDDLGSGAWELADVDIRMNGRALFFKTIAVRQRLIYRKYQRIPPSTTIEQAIARVLSDNGGALAASR
jgi:hypothetical protein